MSKDKNTEKVVKDVDAMLERLELGGVTMSEEDQKKYVEAEDSLGVFEEGMIIAPGYKKCGRCRVIKKFYLFNKNRDSKTNTTGNCKDCQREAAQKSYSKTKHKRDYKKYYAENKERKKMHSKNHYEKNKDEILKKQKAYHASGRGKRVMQKAHAKRRELMKENKGIPYTREMVIDRDKQGKKYPECYICGKSIREEDSKLHMDHVIPVVIGGMDCFSNVGCAHDNCNLTKKKDGSDVTAEQIQRIRGISEKYIDQHPELFEDCEE